MLSSEHFRPIFSFNQSKRPFRDTGTGVCFACIFRQFYRNASAPQAEAQFVWLFDISLNSSGFLIISRENSLRACQLFCMLTVSTCRSYGYLVVAMERKLSVLMPATVSHRMGSITLRLMLSDPLGVGTDLEFDFSGALIVPYR